MMRQVHLLGFVLPAGRRPVASQSKPTRFSNPSRIHASGEARHRSRKIGTECQPPLMPTHSWAKRISALVVCR
jgi:hypothetical protein